MEKKIDKIIRVALIGPESTAKSTLSKQLAKHYDTVWVQEYSREYLALIKRKYTLDDVLSIAQQQLEYENELFKKANRFIFADTELIVSKVWCEDVFNACPAWISQHILSTQYDLYLLTAPDIPWLDDPLRENPHRRDFFYNWYESELKAINARYVVINGIGDVRLQHAIAAIENFIADTTK